MPPPVPLATTWASFDALPPGAFRRIGSRHFVSETRPMAVSDDGTLWTTDVALGLVAIAPDGRYRVVPDVHCSPSMRGIRAVGEEVRLACDAAVVHVGPRGVTRHPLRARPQSCAWAPSGETLACVVPTGGSHKGKCELCTAADTELVLFDASGNVRWKMPGHHDDVREIYLGEGDTVVLRDPRALRFVRGGSSVGSVAITEAERWLGLSADGRTLISFDDDKSQWVRRTVEKGALMGRSPTQRYSVEREFTGLSGGETVFVALRRPGTEQTPDAWLRAVVDTASGRVVSSWPGHSIEWFNAVSPGGTFAASSWSRYLVRIALQKGKVERSENHALPQALAVSRRGDRMAVLGPDIEHEQLQLFDVASGKVLGRVRAPQFSETVAFSDDGSRVAVAAKHGALLLAEGATGKTLCETEGAPGAWIGWHDKRLVTLYPGDNGDDCDEITDAAVSVLDEQCKVVAKYEVHGMIERIEERPDALVISAAKWKHDCGDDFELLPAEALSIDKRTGKATKLPDAVLAQLQARREAEIATRKALIDQGAYREEVLSADGKTAVWLEAERHGTERRQALACVDRATGKALARHALPTGATLPIAIAPQGEWMAVADATSVLLYPCRTP